MPSASCLPFTNLQTKTKTKEGRTRRVDLQKPPPAWFHLMSPEARGSGRGRAKSSLLGKPSLCHRHLTSSVVGLEAPVSSVSRVRSSVCAVRPLVAVSCLPNTKLSYRLICSSAPPPHPPFPHPQGRPNPCPSHPSPNATQSTNPCDELGPRPRPRPRLPGPDPSQQAPQQQRVPGRSSPTPAYLGTWALRLSTAHRSCPSGPRDGNG